MNPGGVKRIVAIRDLEEPGRLHERRFTNSWNFQQLLAVDPGFGHDPTALMTVSFPPNRYSADETQQLVRRMPVSKHVVSYAVSIARATRPNDPGASEYVRRYVEWGAGPRAGQNLILSGKALAVLAGEPAVSAEHVRQAVMPVQRHRVLPNYNAVGEGVDAVAIIKHIVGETSEPAYR